MSVWVAGGSESKKHALRVRSMHRSAHSPIENTRHPGVDKYEIHGSRRFWQSAPGDARSQEFVIDFGGERKVASVEIEWEVW